MREAEEHLRREREEKGVGNDRCLNSRADTNSSRGVAGVSTIQSKIIKNTEGMYARKEAKRRKNSIRNLIKRSDRLGIARWARKKIKFWNSA